MIIPYSTDAPIYHFPAATLGVIAANVAAFVAWYVVPPEAIEPFALKLGGGMHPLQWLTHNFLHAGILHLVFNMIFLWAYGIIVEGKVGWWAFLLIYLGIGSAQGAAIQAAYLSASAPGHAIGASASVFGLMAICMIWAPVNEIGCLFVFFAGLRIITHLIELKIYLLVLLQLALEGLSTGAAYLLKGDPMSSGLLHLSGALWGLAIGLALLKLGLVDCEGWDVLSMITKRRALRAAWNAREARLDRTKRNEALPKSARPREDRPGVSPEERSAILLAKAHEAIEGGDLAAAQAAIAKWTASAADRPPRDALLGVIKAMHGRGAKAESVPPMRAFCRLYPEKADRVRLRLASLLIRDLERPTEARRQLELVADDALDADLRALRRRLRDEADRMIEDGVLELEEEG